MWAKRKGKSKRKYLWSFWGLILPVFCLAGSYFYLEQKLPDRLNIIAGEQEEIKFPDLFRAANLPLFTLQMTDRGVSIFSMEDQEEWQEPGQAVSGLNPSNIPSGAVRIAKNKSVNMFAQDKGSYQMEVKLFGLVKVKDVQVDVVEENYAVPCGVPVGIYLKSKGVMVIGTGSLKGADGLNVEPAYGILRSGDYIEAINGTPLTGKEELIEAVNQAKEEKVTLNIRRGREEIQVSMNPVLDEDGKYKLGAWVRDDTQGIGTMTYVDLNGQFGALGHGISDSDTGEVVEILEGGLYETQVVGLEKGAAGKPGVMSGVIYYGPGYRLGSIKENTETGVYGQADEAFISQIDSQAVPIGFRQDVHEGEALLRSSVSGAVKDYQIQIQKVDYSANQKIKSIVFKVTDQELLDLTGGVIQGMSGSPILQDGKLIGAVTHVFVQDSTKGYGIFIENMLSH